MARTWCRMGPGPRMGGFDRGSHAGAIHHESRSRPSRAPTSLVAMAALVNPVAPFRRVLRRPVLRRVLPAMLLSAIGDGMSVVAVAWLAVGIAPPGQSGVWTALAVAAYSLPATLGAAVLARLVRGLPGTALVTVDAALRAVALGTLAGLAITGRLAGLLAVTCAFFFLYGPVEVALPIHIADEVHGSAALLGTFWATFGIGAIAGSLGAGLLRHRPLWAVVAAIIAGWGAALLPLGLTGAVLPGLIGFAAGGVIYGPFSAICTALFQGSSPPHLLSRVLATRAALTTPSTAAGTLLGGPIVAAIGGQRTLLASALLTIALGVAVAAVRRRSLLRDHSGT